jgi:Zn-dependent protease
MRSWSLPAGRLFGVDLRIHITFIALLLFVWVTQSVTMGTNGAVRGVALVAIIFACVVLHELGHALVAQRSGVAVRSIILLPIGGVTLMEDMGPHNSNPARDIRIAIAGPLVNLVIAAISGALILALLPQARLW